MKIPSVTVIGTHEVMAPMPDSLRDGWLCFNKVPIKGIYVLCYFGGAEKMSPKELEAVKVKGMPDVAVVIHCPTLEVGQQISVSLSLCKDHFVYTVHGAIYDTVTSVLNKKINSLIYEAFNMAGMT